MEEDKSKIGLGCPNCGGAGGPVPDGATVEMAKNVYRYLRLGSPRLAFAAACGVPCIPWSFRVEADFTSTSQTNVFQAGNDVKIVQDTFIEEIKIQVQNQNTPGGLDSLTNYFFELESGIEAIMKVVGPGTGYVPVPQYTPLKHIARKFSQDSLWLLTYNNGVQMDFQATVTPLPFLVNVTVTFEGFTSAWPKIIDMTQAEAVRSLKKLGYLCDAYEQLYCT
jgi:hypothetical protein